MDRTQLILSGSNLFLASVIGASGLIGWLGTITWKLSGTLSSLSTELKGVGTQMVQMQNSISQTQNSLEVFRSEVNGEFKEVRKELMEINTRLSHVEGYVGLAAAGKGG